MLSSYVICISYLSSSPCCLYSFCGLLAHLPRETGVGGMQHGVGGMQCGVGDSGWEGTKPAVSSRSLPGLPRPCILLAPSSLWLATLWPLSASGHLNLNRKIKGLFSLFSFANQKNYRNEFKWLTARKGYLGRVTIAERALDWETWTL